MKITKAFWLAIVCVNFYYFTQNAFAGTSVFWLSPHYSQWVWFLLVGLWGRILYREIRKATNDRV